MRKGIGKILILAVSGALVLLVISGCQEKTAIKQKGSITKDKTGKPVFVKSEAGKTGSKPAGILATENIELKKQMADKDKQIQELKASLDKCLSDKDLAIIDKDKTLDEIGDEASKAFQENIEMMIKIEELQKQIDQMKEPNKPQ